MPPFVDIYIQPKHIVRLHEMLSRSDVREVVSKLNVVVLAGGRPDYLSDSLVSRLNNIGAGPVPPFVYKFYFGEDVGAIVKHHDGVELPSFILYSGRAFKHLVTARFVSLSERQ